MRQLFGAPGAIRTPDPLVRSQILYPTELRVRCKSLACACDHLTATTEANYRDGLRSWQALFAIIF